MFVLFSFFRYQGMTIWHCSLHSCSYATTQMEAKCSCNNGFILAADQCACNGEFLIDFNMIRVEWWGFMESSVPDFRVAGIITIFLFYF